VPAPTPAEQYRVLVAIGESEVRYVDDRQGPPIYDVPTPLDPDHVAFVIGQGLARLGEVERVGLSEVQPVSLTPEGQLSVQNYSA